jgi:hypothetical protein
LAVRGRAGVGSCAERNGEEKETREEEAALGHARPYSGGCCQAFRSHVMSRV